MIKEKILVVNQGHEKLILTEYNGKRYCFHKGIPIEIPIIVYNEIIKSGHVSSQDIVPYEPNVNKEPAPAKPLDKKELEKNKGKGKK